MFFPVFSSYFGADSYTKTYIEYMCTYSIMLSQFFTLVPWFCSDVSEFFNSQVRAGELLMSISRDAATEVVDEMEERRGVV